MKTRPVRPAAAMTPPRQEDGAPKRTRPRSRRGRRDALRPPSWWAAWAVSLAAPAPLILLLNTQLLAPTRDLVLYDCGVAAYTWWLVSVALSTRPRALDRRIGLPALYQLHGVLGVLALLLASAHVLNLFTMHPIIYWSGRVAWFLAIFGVVYAALLMSGWLVDRLLLAAAVKRRLGRFLTHEASVWIHRLNFVMIGLVVLHVHVIPRVSAATGFVIALDLYTLAALAVYLWGRLIAPAAPGRRGTVVANTALNDTTRQVVIAPAAGATAYEPGDFCFVTFHTPGLPVQAHPFSVTFAPEYARASAAAESPATASPAPLVLTIREAGDFTSQLSRLPVGADVTLEGPFGRFNRVVGADDRPLVLLGMGTGIAPLVGLAQAYAASRRVMVLHSVSRPEDLYYDDVLSSLARHNPTFHYNHHRHRYTRADLAALLDADLLAHGRFVVVGPAPAVLAMRHTLRALGVPARHLLDERLTT
ncbi:MAG: iron reductase [Actinomyces succiniciruminis]|nr:iron reductase [Actinomyces succiniciruminis]